MNVNLMMSHACRLLSGKVFGEFKIVNLFLVIDEEIDKLRCVPRGKVLNFVNDDNYIEYRNHT